MNIPPIKSQGIKSKLLPWIQETLTEIPRCWREPFMGTGVIALNIKADRYVLSDANPYIIQFYLELQKNTLTVEDIRIFLEQEGQKLKEIGEKQYYTIRERFNDTGQSLDFLFLNRACFNGMIRFNKNGKFNVPFCRKTDRFSKAYITKIVNQAKVFQNFLQKNEVSLKISDFRKSLAEATKEETVYCDPPYIDRTQGYYNDWNQKDEEDLFSCLKNFQGKFLLSTWHHNTYRENTFIKNLWNIFNVRTQEHFYHLGGEIKNRNSMIEALITNF